eukprot:NODE_4058_length_499_cov_70.166667_g3463_i0.p4 GENE.NODE_4058_length_499_cov_70.166667_g3463_i0~~NODE_4058_length_499_cov_70.166667_g3463_i0.p4  ORF type:complete len:69 (-),score=27.07 NODE_4058_length_499_cov_70.166667_g3463_i0:35-241(-)
MRVFGVVRVCVGHAPGGDVRAVGVGVVGQYMGMKEAVRHCSFPYTHTCAHSARTHTTHTTHTHTTHTP